MSHVIFEFEDKVEHGLFGMAAGKDPKAQIDKAKANEDILNQKAEVNDGSLVLSTMERDI